MRTWECAGRSRSAGWRYAADSREAARGRARASHRDPRSGTSRSAEFHSADPTRSPRWASPASRMRTGDRVPLGRSRRSRWALRAGGAPKEHSLAPLRRAPHRPCESDSRSAEFHSADPTRSPRWASRAEPRCAHGDRVALGKISALPMRAQACDLRRVHSGDRRGPRGAKFRSPDPDAGPSERRVPLGRPDAVPALGVPPQSPDAHTGTVCAELGRISALPDAHHLVRSILATGLFGAPSYTRPTRCGPSERRVPLGRPDAVPALGEPRKSPDAHMGTMCARPRESRRSENPAIHS